MKGSVFKRGPSFSLIVAHKWTTFRPTTPHNVDCTYKRCSDNCEARAQADQVLRHLVAEEETKRHLISIEKVTDALRLNKPKANVFPIAALGIDRYKKWLRDTCKRTCRQLGDKPFTDGELIEFIRHLESRYKGIPRGQMLDLELLLALFERHWKSKGKLLENAAHELLVLLQAAGRFGVSNDCFNDGRHGSYKAALVAHYLRKAGFDVRLEKRLVLTRTNMMFDKMEN